MNKTACEEFGLVPCDIVRYGGKVAICLGMGEIDGIPSVFFETEQMVKQGLGVGVFAVGPLPNPVEIVARNAGPATVVKRLSDGQEIQMSANTEDFLRASVLPGDVVIVGGKLATIVGIVQATVYIQRMGSQFCEPLKGDVSLVYRRVNVPTSCVVRLERETIHGWVDLEHLRDCWVSPGDVIKGGLSVICVPEPGCFVCMRNEGKQPEVVNLPVGSFPVIVKSGVFYHKLSEKRFKSKSTGWVSRADVLPSNLGCSRRSIARSSSQICGGTLPGEERIKELRSSASSRNGLSGWSGSVAIPLPPPNVNEREVGDDGGNCFHGRDWEAIPSLVCAVTEYYFWR
jgi:hypothetical protein